MMNLADSIALSVNVSAKVMIDGKTILDIFESGELPEKWEGHIGSMFLECADKRLLAFMNTYHISAQNVKKIYDKTPLFYHTERAADILRSYGDLTGEADTK